MRVLRPRSTAFAFAALPLVALVAAACGPGTTVTIDRKPGDEIDGAVLPPAPQPDAGVDAPDASAGCGPVAPDEACGVFVAPVNLALSNFGGGAADQRKKALKHNNSVLDSRFELQTYVTKTAPPRPAQAGGSKS